MLVLERKPGQVIEITFDQYEPPITIMVSSVQGKCVKLAIDAPEHMGIWRKELADERRAQGRGKQ